MCNTKLDVLTQLYMVHSNKNFYFVFSYHFMHSHHGEKDCGKNHLPFPVLFEDIMAGTYAVVDS